MPKNSKPKGGRPARNFEPRYGAKKTSFHDRQAGRGFGTPRSERADAGERRPDAGLRPGSRSPKHRGFRPAETEAPKRRWTAQERAGRDEARTIRNRAESGRREAPHHRGEDRADRGYTERRFEARRFDDRGDRGFGARRTDDRGERRFGAGGAGDRAGGVGDRNGRRFEERGERRFDDRPRRDERPTAGRFGRDERSGRPQFGRDERPRFDGAERAGSDRRDDRAGQQRRDDRGGFDRRDDRARFDRSERPMRDDRPRRDDRAGRDERPRFDRAERAGFDRRDDRAGRQRRDDRGGFDRTERFGTERPRDDRFDRTDGPVRPARNDRPRFDRPTRDDRPRYDRADRATSDPRRDERPRREDRPTRSDWNRPETASRARTEKEQADDVVHERLEAQAVQAGEVADVTFADLGLGSNITEVLRNMGAETPFPIQAATIPSILQGRDVLGRGRTGSGKTIAFGAPLVESILKSQAGKRREIGRKPRAIILAPTRELALQIDRTVQPIARSVGLFTTQIYGGVPQARQVGALKKGVDIIIGTPGRIEDLIEQGKLDLSEVRIAVLDEADHMCELGFVEPVQRILRHCGEGSQKLLFSATLDREVAALVDEFLVDPAVYEVAGEDQESSSIEHRVLVIEHRDKAEVLTSLVDRDGQTLVFARTRAYAEMLAEQFEDAGIAAVSLHGDLNQAKRTRNLQKLTAGKVQVLVATDVAARGIHVDDIDLVVQADAPDEYKTYLHRAGRTGRAGRSGRVVTLITRHRRRRMEDLLGRAEIDAPFENAQPGDDVIEEIAGRMPSAAELTS
ncbi:DEAD/DEAH box helicase [Microbacterium sp.]|uniref:DEAD/DEAH box helicase n=1 Tax=Microbacterium sp. TaxID=51671 RepID=UPI0028110B8F|nr:DEAD/DEAH box helicase [Microbacterium sp.]